MQQIDLYLIGKHNIMKTVLDLYGSDNKKTFPLILDCGCGMGTYAYKLNEGSYVGLDVNLSSIKLAQDFHPDSMFIVGDATKLPFNDQVFDCVICSEVLEHIPDDTALLAELARVTKIPCKLIVSVPNIECKNVFVEWQRSLIDKEVGHFRSGYKFSGISSLLTESGFKAKKYKYDCGPVTAIVESIAITLSGVFGYKPSDLGNLFEENRSLLMKTFLRVYKSLFPLITLFMCLDRLLPERYRSNIALLAEK